MLMHVSYQANMLESNKRAETYAPQKVLISVALFLRTTNFNCTPSFSVPRGGPGYF